MNLINTDGMAIIGPGSEWFWTAFSGIVLAVTFLAIYRQLRLQADQAAIEQLDKRTREYGSERMVRCKLEVLTALRDGVDRAHLPGAFAEPMAIHWEDMGTAVRGKHLSAEAVWKSHSNQVQFAWGLLSPTLLRWRGPEDGENIFEDFEWLAATMATMDRRAGVNWAYAEPPTDEMQSLIVKFQAQVRMQEALRAVVIAPPVAAPAPHVAALSPSLAAAEG